VWVFFFGGGVFFFVGGDFGRGRVIPCEGKSASILGPFFGGGGFRQIYMDCSMQYSRRDWAGPPPRAVGFGGVLVFLGGGARQSLWLLAYFFCGPGLVAARRVPPPAKCTSQGRGVLVLGAPLCHINTFRFFGGGFFGCWSSAPVIDALSVLGVCEGFFSVCWYIAQVWPFGGGVFFMVNIRKFWLLGPPVGLVFLLGCVSFLPGFWQSTSWCGGGFFARVPWEA